MEESNSNGGIEDQITLKEVVLEDSAALKADIDGKKDSSSSSSSSSSSDEEAEAEEEKSVPIEEEKLVSESVDHLELEARDSGVAETEVKILESLEETNKDSEVVTDLQINGLKEETEQLESSLDESNGCGDAVDVVSKGIELEESSSPSLAENFEVAAAAEEQGITEREIPVSDNNAEGSSGSTDLACKDDHVEDSLQAINVPVVETRDAGEAANKPDIPETTGNQPIYSLSNRPEQPTSWKSCCGLFEVLRRSDR
ncbi:hypothetical protein CCACVL1_23505 [Corchorus capsularis]|uniref:Uncharacterized protein n=1 Tax=Corchorus capsularis TaxID=210143 RepID=A0A1R3GTQ2_COCAP|nr:hypothetical protein CCACVL1_23505 [Corchorus capsularis]